MTSTLAGIAGAIAFGFVSDKLFNARRPPVNLLFGLMELAGLGLLFFGPQTMSVLLLAMVLFGLGLTGLVTSLGGLFGVDIAPKRVDRKTVWCGQRVTMRVDPGGGCDK